MRSKSEIFKDLVLLQGDIEELESELSKFPWDNEVPIYSIRTEDFAFVLKRCISEEIDFVTLVRWANALECRDDLGVQMGIIQEFIFELASPEINGDITKEDFRKS